MQYQHLAIREVIGERPDSVLRRPVIPGKWSAHGNIAHLAAYQPVFIDRLQRIARGPSPAFGRYVAEEDKEFPAYLDRPTASLLEQIDADRSRICSLLAGADDSFQGRTASHPRFGLLTVIDWTEFFLLHEAHHLYTIYALIHTPSH
ncbi:MAG TPA: DinB family protein [Puia sp.]|nr:DinB family protein [Puia sp.]